LQISFFLSNQIKEFKIVYQIDIFVKIKLMIIRKAVQEDMKSVLNLIQELAIFEKEPVAVVITVDDLVRDGFSKSPLFCC